MVRKSLTSNDISLLLASIPVMLAAYLFLRKIIFGPLELYGWNFFSKGTQVTKFDSRFKEVEAFIKNGKLKSALEALNKMLEKYPKFKQAQIRKIRLLAHDCYEISKALEYSREVLEAGRFNRNKMDILIIITAILRQQGFAGEAANLSEEYRNKTSGHFRKLIENMEENRKYSQRAI